MKPPEPIRILDSAATDRALPHEPLVEALRAMLLRKHAGRTAAPERLAVPLTGGTLLAMPACDGDYASTKLVTVHPGNPARGLPTLLGEVLLMRADTGERLLMLDGPTLTGRRTAALSVLATRVLAPRARGPLLIVGAGEQGRVHLEAYVQAMGVSEVFVASRSFAKAQALAEHGRALGARATAIEHADRAIADAGIIVTATTSTAPVFTDRVADDAFVAAVGAYRPQMCELPAGLLHRARVYVDDPAGARHEAGDILQAGLDWNRVTALEAVLAGAAPPPDSGPVVFKSVGQALWDLAAARLALETAK
ncbi:MAG TPA: delta(1)-pyrroline-2-carboxylate reductase family protein [Quisquiliibacterium sp.]|nr:delta(1)-pyrroline-2-carboxylate reductase family protein [Quisquiliibacterium sp.]